MRRTVILLLSLLIAALLPTHASASNKVEFSPPLGGEWSQEHTSLSAHLAALDGYQAQTTEMKKRMQVHENRLEQLANKPHMDPKGLHRFASKMMFNQLRSQMEKIEQKITWHHEQIRQLQA
ncbi:MAG: hypothetical protein OEZ41_13035 [Nitrospirota bacterium]|nr:hypothetical protein [Nitrospirota bacterium]